VSRHLIRLTVNPDLRQGKLVNGYGQRFTPYDLFFHPSPAVKKTSKQVVNPLEPFHCKAILHLYSRLKRHGRKLYTVLMHSVGFYFWRSSEGLWNNTNLPL